MNQLTYKLDAALDVLDCKIVPRDGEDDQTDVTTINCVVAHMEHTLNEHIRDAMLDYLRDLPEDDRDWDPKDPPAEVTSWSERPYMPSACSTCGDDWPEVTINYRTVTGETGWLIVQDDFGRFVSALCERKAKATE